MPEIIVIPPTKTADGEMKKIRTAAYARVSSDSDEQEPFGDVHFMALFLTYEETTAYEYDDLNRIEYVSDNDIAGTEYAFDEYGNIDSIKLTL